MPETLVEAVLSSPSPASLFQRLTEFSHRWQGCSHQRWTGQCWFGLKPEVPHLSLTVGLHPAVSGDRADTPGLGNSQDHEFAVAPGSLFWRRCSVCFRVGGLSAKLGTSKGQSLAHAENRRFLKKSSLVSLGVRAPSWRPSPSLQAFLLGCVTIFGVSSHGALGP